MIALAIIALYLLGSLLTWRFTYLKVTENLQKRQAQWDHLYANRQYSRNTRPDEWEPEEALVILGPIFWWALAIYFFVMRGFVPMIKFLMFPKGVNTKFSREQAAKKAAEEAKKLSQKYGLDYPE